MEPVDNDTVGIIFDIGSDRVKAAFHDKCSPMAVFSSQVATPKEQFIGELGQQFYIGDFYPSLKSKVDIHLPIERGIVKDWDLYEKLLDHIYDKQLYCNLSPVDHPALFTEMTIVPKRQREKLTSLMFETYNVPLFYVVDRAVCVLMASGNYSGLVWDFGESCQIVPVHHLSAMKQAAVSLDISGTSLNKYLGQLLHKRGYTFKTIEELLTLRHMKEQYCYVATGYDDEARICEAVSHLVPDGSSVELITERYQCPETLFNPSLLDLDSPGIHQCAHKLIVDNEEALKDVESPKTRFIISGASAMFPGLAERLKKEFSDNLPKLQREVSIVCPPERRSSVWLGAAVFYGHMLENNPSMWISKSDFDEWGPEIVNLKCF